MEAWGLCGRLLPPPLPQQNMASPHPFSGRFPALGYLTLLFWVEFLTEGRIQATLSVSFSLSKLLSERRGLSRWSPTQPLLAFLVMAGIRHSISPTSLLPRWYQVAVMPSIFPFLSRAAMYGGGGHSLHKDTRPREEVEAQAQPTLCLTSHEPRLAQGFISPEQRTHFSSLSEGAVRAAPAAPCHAESSFCSITSLQQGRSKGGIYVKCTEKGGQQLPPL